MGSLSEKPFTGICPRTGSSVFIRDELLHLTKPIEVVCPACDHWHIWNPLTLTLREEDDTEGDGGARISQ